MNIGYLLMSVAKKMKYQLNNTLKKRDITAQQWAVIANIDLLSQSGIVTLVDISKQLEIDKPTLSGILNRLEVKGLINKRIHPTDKRSAELILSERGKESLKEYQELSDQVLNEFIHELSINEQEQLKELLVKLDK